MLLRGLFVKPMTAKGFLGRPRLSSVAAEVMRLLGYKVPALGGHQ